MKNKIKKVSGYVFLFIQSLILLSITILLVLRLTVLDKSFIKNELNKNNYYKKINDEIKTEMTYYTDQSGFDDSILDNIFSLIDIKNTTNSFISSIYNGETYTVNTSQIEEKLNNNINKYIENEHFQIVDQEQLNKFVKQIASVYSDEIKLMGYLDKVCKYIPKLIDFIDYAIVVLFALFVLLLILNEKLIKRRDYSVILYTSGFIILFIIIGFRSSIDIKNLLIYSKTISNTFISIIKYLFNVYLLISLIYIGVGLIIDILKKDKKRRHKKAII
ncbi:MAG: hypothetical protein IJ105_01705 [Bacilli bacterium]|nr:hypothetical protein [Bacilli bacterium]